ncbi:MAG: HTH domain-containing protein [Candidatus Helarchaeota archaeon]|nr:HTH domain-containing protein [Candidatus Helarchaeota archaeon]
MKNLRKLGKILRNPNTRLILDFIINHPTSFFSLKMMSEQLNLSKSSITRTLKLLRKFVKFRVEQNIEHPRGGYIKIPILDETFKEFHENLKNEWSPVENVG